MEWLTRVYFLMEVLYPCILTHVLLLYTPSWRCFTLVNLLMRYLTLLYLLILSGNIQLIWALDWLNVAN